MAEKALNILIQELNALEPYQKHVGKLVDLYKDVRDSIPELPENKPVLDKLETIAHDPHSLHTNYSIDIFQETKENIINCVKAARKQPKV